MIKPKSGVFLQVYNSKQTQNVDSTALPEQHSLRTEYDDDLQHDFSNNDEMAPLNSHAVEITDDANMQNLVSNNLSISTCHRYAYSNQFSPINILLL